VDSEDTEAVRDWRTDRAMNALASDLDHVLASTEPLWHDLRGQRVFITGGTGFFGCWLLESFLWANDALDLEASVVVLTRRPHVFVQKAPHLASHPALRLHQGDVRTFGYPEGEFHAVVHAAPDSGPGEGLPLFDSIVTGTRRTLEFARSAGAQRFLLTSSGAVYGRQPADLDLLPEEYPGAPDPVNSRATYGEGKRSAEMLCTQYAEAGRLEPTIARCFTFVGPYLPLDVHFAAGNFIRDGLNGGPIRIAGDGTPYRSYLYAADLAIWLWTILLRGRTLEPYNVGSDVPTSIAELAHLVAGLFRPRVKVDVARPPVPGALPERYVPAVVRAQVDLGLHQTVPVFDALRRTIDWHVGTRRGASVISR
jgi:nucleoside-diphosphate-sugar epimerase